VLSDGDLTPFFARPICVVLWVTIVLVIAAKIPIVQRIARQLTGRAAAPAG
jgi:TctA family transporter